VNFKKIALFFSNWAPGTGGSGSKLAIFCTQRHGLPQNGLQNFIRKEAVGVIFI